RPIPTAPRSPPILRTAPPLRAATYPRSLLRQPGYEDPPIVVAPFILASNPVASLNQISRPLGIPFRSFQIGTCSSSIVCAAPPGAARRGVAESGASYSDPAGRSRDLE